MDTPTKKQITEEAPRENEQNSRVLIDQSPIALEFFNRAGLLIRVNPACLQLFGITDISEIYKFSLFSDPNLSAERKRAIKHGQSIRYEALFDFEKVKELKLYQTTKSGQIWLDISITPTKDDVGSISGYILQIQDITARKAAEEKISQSERKFANLLQNIQSIAIQGYSSDGTTRYWNKASEELYGYSQAEALGRNLIDLVIPPEMRSDVKQAMRQMAATGKPIPSAELSLMRKDGTRISVYSNHTIVTVPGLPPELYCFDVDFTTRKTVENELTINYETALELSKSENSEEVYEILTNRLKEIIGDNNYLAISAYDKDSDSVKIIKLIGFEKLINRITKLIGVSPLDIKVKIKDLSQKQLNLFTNHSLRELPGGVYESGIGKIPKIVSKLIEKLVGIKKLYAIGLTTSINELRGGIIIIQRDNYPLNNNLIENIINQTSVLLDKFSSASDIRNTQQLLLAEQEKYKQIFENANDEIVYLNAAGIILSVNSKIEEIFGYKPQEVIGKNFLTMGVFESDTLVKIAKLLEEVSITGTSTFQMELTGKHKDGHKIFIQTNNRVIKKNGKIERLVVVIRDITETKKQQSAIKELGDFLQNTINSVADPLFVKDDHYRFVIANDALCKMLGMERKDILGKTLGESLPADQVKHFLAIDKAVLDSGQSDTSEEELTGKDKAVLTIITKKTRYVDKNGQRFLVGVVRDVTERKKMENRAAVAVRYRQLFETTQDGILLVDYATGKILDVNLYMIEMLGYSKSNMVRKYLWEISELAGAVASKKEFRELKKKASVHFQDLVLQTKTGKKMAVECIATTYEVNGERIIQYNIRDINVRKRAELVLSNLMNRDQAILESIGDVVFATDKDQNILLFNWAAEQITGISDQQAIGRHYRQIFNMIQEKDGQPIVDIIGQALRDDKIVDPMLPTLLVRKDGQNTPITVLAAPVEDGQGKIIGAVVVIHDITKEHQIDKVKSEFVSLASHQLRTPTTAIKWYAEVLAGEEIGELNAKQKKYINEISHGNQRMIDLMDSLLGVSRIELGTMRAKAKPLRLDEVADDVLREAQPIIDGKKIVVEKKYELGAGNIVSDQALIRIVLQNVLSNAATYTAAKGKITVAIAATAVGARLTITDNGCGVPPAALSELGRKFFRADNASIVNPDGTGLGLYVAISMAKKVGGTVEIKSKEGVGTKVLIDLPNLGRSKNITKPTGSG